MDRIEVANPNMIIDRDVRLSGFASFVGRSSMEVTLKIDQVWMKKRSEEHFPRDYLLRIIMVNGNIFYMLYLFLLQEILEHRSKSLFCSINDRSN